ncbi:MAG: glycosyltransferase family 4 protein, partial [Candidatus Staskawiczbacteria bacterium]|nr:glycosyltransferase family 4 protein [Candidatus Staskawiczbacteria bacterium]
MKKTTFKIAVIAPPFAVIPPEGHGGTERIAYEMAEGFKKKGHKVTLFGAGSSKTSVKFIRLLKKTIWERKNDASLAESFRCWRIETVYLAMAFEEIIKKENNFDIIFNHSKNNYIFLPLVKFIKTPIVNILHLPLFKEAEELYSRFKNSNVITVSDGQRKGFSKIDYLGTVYNGVDVEKFQFSAKPKNYFLFLGAMGGHKNPKDAILAAKKAGVRLILAGGKKREPYFSKEIKPLIDGKKIKYVGEIIQEKEKINLLKNAKALLFPIKWPEPFGLAAIEAMACGTPVIAYTNGALPEIIENKKNGFI